MQKKTFKVNRMIFAIQLRSDDISSIDLTRAVLPDWDNKSLLTILLYCKNLERISLAEALKSPAWLNYLQQRPSKPDLSHIHYSNHLPYSRNSRYLRPESCPKLKYLNLSFNLLLTDECLVGILLACPNIEVVRATFLVSIYFLSNFYLVASQFVSNTRSQYIGMDW